MKKNYETPSVERVAFQYRDQVVAASGIFTQCNTGWYNYNTNDNTNCHKVSDSTKDH